MINLKTTLLLHKKETFQYILVAIRKLCDPELVCFENTWKFKSLAFKSNFIDTEVSR